MLGSAILLLADMYQFSSLKYSCLDKCRSPMTFIIERWLGGNAVMKVPKRSALVLITGFFASAVAGL